MKEITERLMALADEKYAAFQAKLIPGAEKDSFIGVRVPVLRAFAKELAREEACGRFLAELPHRYYDENMLHSVLLTDMREYEKSLAAVDAFLPFVDNWAVCDTLSPKSFRKNKARLLPEIRRWAGSGETYTARFGMEMLMSHFLDADFRPEYLEIPAAVRLEDYYAKMMAAWFFATALAKQWDATVPYIENHVLGTWTHNKAIQKACESFRITPEQKAYLRTLKR